MRIAGYLLLMSGFAWLLFFCGQLATFALTREIGIEHMHKYTPDAKYSGADVDDAIRSVITDYRRYRHGVVGPAFVMLCGGVLLDLANRRGRKAAGLPTS